MVAPPSRSAQDYKYDFFKSLVDGLGPTLFGTINTNQTNGLPTVQQVSDLYATGSATAPGAGAVVATAAAVAAGTYDITVYANISGTTAALDRLNLALKLGAGTNMVIPTTMGGITDVFTYRASFGVATDIKTVAIAASTAGSIYSTTLSVRKLA